MGHKRIEDLDFYEILNLDKDASPEDIANSFRQTASLYHPDSMASYGLVTDEERRLMLDRIEQAYRTLIDPEKRSQYDKEKLGGGLLSSSRARFRRSVEKLVIQDADQRTGLRERIQRFFRRKKGKALF